MVIHNRVWKRGRINLPIFPAILVVGLLVAIAGYQFPKQASHASAYYLDDADIRGTLVASFIGKDVDFVVYLSPTGSKRVAAWREEKPDSEISLSYGDKLIGKLKLSPALDTSILHFTVTPEKAMAVRYAMGK